MRRIKEIENLLKETVKDERLSYPSATVFENAPLALMQAVLEMRVQTLKWVLNKEKENE